MGRVQDTRGRVSSGSMRSDGRRVVGINKQNYLVHRLVAYAHLRVPPTPMHECVVHKDGIATNNVADNLAYATTSGVRAHRQAIEEKSSTNSSNNPALHQEASEGRQTHVADVRHLAIAGEMWTDVIDSHAGLPMPGYQVSSLGRVLMRRGCMTSGSKCLFGYRSVVINGRKFPVHRLVARAFLGPPGPAHFDVNHIDGIRDNNSLVNLEYTSRSDNILHSYQTMLRKCSGPANSRAVIGRKVGTYDYVSFRSVHAAAAHIDGFPQNVSACCTGRRKSTAGWEFEHADSTVDTGLEYQDEAWVEVLLEPPSS